MTPVTEATMMDFGNSSQEEPEVLFPCPACNAPPLLKTLRVVREKPPSLTQSGARKLQVKNLREANKGKSEKYFNTTWESLDKALEAVFQKEKVQESMEVLYRGVENLCRLNKAPELFERLKKRLEDYVSTELKPKILEDVQDNDIETARLINFAWTQWEKQLVAISYLPTFLDHH
jgi:hypothetical protein